MESNWKKKCRCRSANRLLAALVVLMPVCAGSAARGEEAASAGGSGSAATLTVDFGKWVDHPLVKSKIGLYNSGYIPGGLRTYRRDAQMLDGVRPDSLRFDGGLGSPRGIILSRPPMVSGSPSDPTYDFREADRLVDLLNSRGVRPYWCYSYVPGLLAPEGGDFRDPPEDMQQWAAVLGAVAGHFRQTGRTIAFHEIYNEPDNRDFFRGTLDDYLSMYEHGARAIRSADPEARVGGPSLAFTESWIRPFLEHVTRRNIPLDFFSFHFYPGVPYTASDIRGVVEMVRRELAVYPSLATTEMHLNEYNSLPIHYPENGPQQKHALAARLLDDFAYFVSQPCLTSVHWAQFMDTGGGNWSGLVGITGHRKAAYNALAIYAGMPVDRRQVEIESSAGLGAMASSDGHTCAVVVWNTGKTEQNVRLKMGGVPFETGDMRVYRIDADNASHGDGSAREDLAAVQERRGVSMDGARWEGPLPAGGVVYIEADDGSGLSGLTPYEGARVVHVLHSYPDRDSPGYAYFDRRTWIARLGMGGDEQARAEVGVVADDLPKFLEVAVEVDGQAQPPARGGLLGVRLDYLAGTEWASSVLFHGRSSGGAANQAVPWGTRARPDQDVRVPDLARFRIEPSRHAPEGWTGRTLITFAMHGAPAHARAKITVR